MKGKLIGRGRTAEIFAWGENQALKLYAKDIPAARVEGEAETGRLIFESGIPSPAVEGVIELEGQTGIIFERVTGPTMLEFITRKPWLIAAIARQFAELHFKMHSQQAHHLSSQGEKLKNRLENTPSISAETRHMLLDLLNNLPTGTAICHGDFHPDNIIMSTRGPVIIDWADATRGNSLYDLARTSYLLSRAKVPPGISLYRRVLLNLFRYTFHAFYLNRYRKLNPFSRSQLAEWTKIMAAARLVEGIDGEEAQLLAIVNRT